MKREEVILNLLTEAWSHRSNGNYESAREALKKVHQMCDETDFLLLGRVHHIYMQFESDADDFDKALAFCQKALSFYKQSGDNNRIAHSTRHLADLLMEMGQEQDAEIHYKRAIDFYTSTDNNSSLDLANCLRGYALCLESLNKEIEAKQHWETVAELYGRLNLTEGVTEANQHLNKS